MAGFCLIPTLAEKFLTKLKSGEINPEKLMDMTSAERHAFFGEFLGDANAREVNALFESKLLLKNQQEGIINWAKTVTGIKPMTERDILAKATRLGEVLQPKEMDAFLNDLANQRLGIDITAEEAGKIADMAKTIAEKKKAYDGKQWTSEEARNDYGAAVHAFGQYVGELKLETNKTTALEMLTSPIKLAKEIGGISKSIQSSFDNSAIWRPGMKVLFNKPDIWAKNALQSFVDIWNGVTKKGGSEMVERAVKADVFSRVNNMNGLYKQAKLAVAKPEEAFPESIVMKAVKKIPGVGRIYGSTERAYTAFQYRNRADLFDRYYEILEKTGAEFVPRNLGKIVNSMTGRGSLGQAEPVGDALNTVFYSMRSLKGNFDFTTAHMGDWKNFTRAEKVIASKNILRTVMGIGAILAIAKAVDPDSVTWDSTSSDFGKIKVGNTRFDVTAGLASLVVLASRIYNQKSTSSSGKITELNGPGFNQKNVGDVVGEFFQNKYSPVMNLLNDYVLRGVDREGNKPTIQGELASMFQPFGSQSIQEALKDPKAANVWAVAILDVLGVGASTYSSGARIPTLSADEPQQKTVLNEFQRLAEKDMKPSIANFDVPTGRLIELQKKLTVEQYQKAKEEYVKNFTDGVTKIMATDGYKNASLDMKQKMINNQNTVWLNNILNKNGVVKKPPTHTPDVS